MSESIIARDTQRDLFDALAVQIDVAKKTMASVISGTPNDDALSSGYMQLTAIEATVEVLKLVVLPKTAGTDNEQAFRHIKELCFNVIEGLEKAAVSL